MEYANSIISTDYLTDLCFKVGDQWHFYPNMLDLFPDRKPPVFIPTVYYPFVDPNYPEYHKRHQHLVGGSGSGKSSVLMRKFLLQAKAESYFRLLYARKTSKSIRNSTFQGFKDTINQLGWGKHFRTYENTMDIRCWATGNMLMSAGLDDVSKLQSIADPTDVWIEEPVSRKPINNITFSDYTELLRRLRTPLAETHIHASYNPISKASFLYKKFEKEKVYPNSELAIIHSTYKDNPFLPGQYVREMQQLIDVNPDEANVFTFGRWGDSSNKGKWMRTYKAAKVLTDVEYMPNTPVSLSFDANVRPYVTMTCFQERWVKRWKVDAATGLSVMRDVLQIRAFMEYCLENPFNSMEFCIDRFNDDFIEPYGVVPCDYYGDATADYGVPGQGSRDVSSRYIPVKNKMQRYGLLHNRSRQLSKSNPFLIDQREHCEAILAGKYDIEVVVDKDNCPLLAEDFAEMREGVHGFDKEKDKEGVEQRGHNWATFSYYVCRKFKHLMKKRGNEDNEADADDE